MKLVRELSTEAKFRALLGRAPKDKVTGEWVGETPSEWPPHRSTTPADAEQASAEAVRPSSRRPAAVGALA